MTSSQVVVIPGGDEVFRGEALGALDVEDGSQRLGFQGGEAAGELGVASTRQPTGKVGRRGALLRRQPRGGRGRPAATRGRGDPEWSGGRGAQESQG